MPVTAVVYAHCHYNLLNKLMNLETDTIKCALCTSLEAPDQEVHNDYADILEEVAQAGNYVTGGAAVANPAVTIAAKVVKFDGDNVAWAASTITARYAIIYDDTPSNGGNKPLIVLIDFGENKSSENGTFQLTFSASGIFTVTVA